MQIKKIIKKIASAITAMAVVLSMPGTPVLAGEVVQAESNSITRTMPQNPVHHCTKDTDTTGNTDTTDWSYVYFGSYPQTEMAGDALTEEISGAAYDGNGDAWVNGTKYRRISKEDTNNSSYFGDSEYRYFKWERIKWRVLKNDGNTLFVIADRGMN